MDPYNAKAWEARSLNQSDIMLLDLIAKLRQAGLSRLKDNPDQASKFEDHLNAMKSIISLNTVETMEAALRQLGEL